MTRPLLLLDVDGVLNAVGGTEGERAVWQQWRRGWATADGTSWPITYAPAVVARLLSWLRDGRVEVQWLTTWGHDANGDLRHLLGLPHLDVAGTYQADFSDGSTSASGSRAAVTRSAPDPLSGRWWKYDVVRRLLDDEDQGRLLIWVDDELQPGTAYRAWSDAERRVQAVGPGPATGLSPADLNRIEQHLEPAAQDESCSRCGRARVPVAYGFPGPDMWEAAERGEIVLGGCVVWDGQPSQRCTVCGADDSAGEGAPW